MNREKFREEVIKHLYTLILNPESEIEIEDEAVKNRVFDVSSHLVELDGIIESNLYKWSIQRLNYVDLAIIRYAVYELVYLDIPKEVIINEALELTKRYSNLDDNQASKFNNRLLQNIVDNLGGKDA